MNTDRWIKIGTLLTVFCIAVMISSLIMNRNAADKTVGLGEPELPRVSFQVQGQTMNHLIGYMDEMDITAMRDTITPIPSNGRLQMNIENAGVEISEIEYKVFSLDGETLHLQGTCELDKPEMKLGTVFVEGRTELVLQVILKTEEQNISYFTRIEKEEGLGLKECLEFAQNFHTMTFNTGNREKLTEYLEPNEKSDNTTYQTVDIHSNAYHICWGDMAPEISTEVEWSIKESNSSYTSLLAKYQVVCKNEEGVDETYNVREFFRVRLSEEEMYLLNYDRSMNQLFEAGSDFLSEYTFDLGITDPDMDYVANEDGTIVSFVQERDLWIYNKKKNELVQAFSFSNDESGDVRSRNDEHALRIISMDEEGNTMFAVYGYMNRGNHEGKVGVAVYYYDIKENVVQERAFIPSTKSFAIAEDELGKMLYCNQERQMLYVLTGGVLYQIDMKRDDQEILAEGLESGQYVVSEDGHLLAYQLSGELNTSTAVQVMNLSTAESYIVNAEKGEAVRPLGFITGDFICGYVREKDKGVTVTGDEVLPMYKMEILESEEKVAKTYEQKDIYLSDVWVDENQITLNRVIKEGELYTGTTQDYITNTEEKRDFSVALETYTTDLKEKQVRLVFEEEIEEFSPEVLKPNLQTTKESVTIAFNEAVKTDQYYVYGIGKLEGIYDSAAHAIQKAEEISGVVISSEQEYIWEKGNRDLGYYIENEPFGKDKGQTSLEACLKYMEKYEADRMDLAGCSLSQVMYIINRGMPVIAMTSTDHAVLLVGYNWIDMYYIDPDTGQEESMSQEDMAAVTAAAGNTFIGFK